jgi:ABC-type uncharacterized transport system substrate-binding protein
MRRREFIALLGGAAAAGPVSARAQQPTMPVVGFIFGGAADASSRYAAAFRKGLSERGYVEGQNVVVEYHGLEGEYDRSPSLVADLVRRRVAVIATLGATPVALAAKAATTTIPIVFSVPDDPVKLGLVASLARPGGNATGVNYFIQEITAKRLGLLHELVPKAARIAVLVNPANPLSTEATLKEAPDAARVLGLQLQCSMPAQAARSTQSLRPYCASVSTPCSSGAMGSSIADAFNLPQWRRATGCLRVILCASTSK